MDELAIAAGLARNSNEKRLNRDKVRHFPGGVDRAAQALVSGWAASLPGAVIGVAEDWERWACGSSE